jgi:hypothetical protein
MTSVDLRMTAPDYQKLRDVFKPSFRHGRCPETGAVGILGESHAGSRHEFMLVKLLVPGPGDFKIAENAHLVFDSSYIRRAHLEMRSKHLAGLVLFHTHPNAGSNVGFSFYDNQQEPLLVENLQELEPSTRLVCLVAGKSSLCGRWWPQPVRAEPLRHL